MKVPVYNMAGKKVDDVNLSGQLFLKQRLIVV